MTLADQSGAAAEAGMDRARAVFRERLGTGEATAAAASRLTAVEGVDAAGDAELVLEAVDEDSTTKRAVHEALESVVPPDTPIASATSTLGLAALAASLARPERLIGLHFLPALRGMDLSGIVEVVVPDGAASAGALVTALDRTPVFVGDRPGFLVNRLMLRYVLEGARRYSRPQREVIDSAARYIGMALGPLELADWIGLDHCALLAEHCGFGRPAALSGQIEAGQCGRASGKGFHDWRGHKRVTASLPPGRAPLGELGRELVEPFVVGAEQARDEDAAANAAAIDVAAVIGAGFPAYTGGPLQYRRGGWDEAPARGTRGHFVSRLRERLREFEPR